MENTRFCAALLILLMFTGIFSLSPAISSLTADVVVRSTGKILSGAYARSGSAEDIQAAVDWVASNGGIGNVYIPEGTFNFVNIGESWKTVNIPAGVSLFGAPTERYTNGSVVEWKTVLVMPYDVPGNDAVGIPNWFHISGNSNPTKPSRFSDIKLVGYRTFNSSSTSMHAGLSVGGGDEGGVINFRVDHCYFLNTAGGGVGVCGSDLQNGPDTMCGVIDHCKFVNTAGVPYLWEDRTVDYGVYVSRGGGWSKDYSPWETDISKVLGKYTNYTVFVEDCYFEKWRHCVVCREGADVVLRHSIIKNDYGYGSVDIHGDSPGRAYEIYNCTFSGCEEDAIWWRAGGGVVFNNTVTDYTVFAYLTRENTDSKYWPHDIWVWNNKLPTGVSPVTTDGGPVKDVDYFLHAPDTFSYMPYPYPHPLTLEP
jgi:hypothetical protein